MKRILLAAVAALGLAGTGHAFTNQTATPITPSAYADGVPIPPPPQPQMVRHNGSLMQIIPMGANIIEIRYVQPRPDLWPYAQPGTLLIRGQWDPTGLVATAFTISRCGQILYPMHGYMDHAGNLVVQGPAPLVDAWTCGVISMIWSPKNSDLLFTPVL